MSFCTFLNLVLWSIGLLFANQCSCKPTDLGDLCHHAPSLSRIQGAIEPTNEPANLNPTNEFRNSLGEEAHKVEQTLNAISPPRISLESLAGPTLDNTVSLEGSRNLGGNRPRPKNQLNPLAKPFSATTHQSQRINRAAQSLITNHETAPNGSPTAATGSTVSYTGGGILPVIGQPVMSTVWEKVAIPVLSYVEGYTIGRRPVVASLPSALAFHVPNADPLRGGTVRNHITQERIGPSQKRNDQPKIKAHHTEVTAREEPGGPEPVRAVTRPSHDHVSGGKTKLAGASITNYDKLNPPSHDGFYSNHGRDQGSGYFGDHSMAPPIDDETNSLYYSERQVRLENQSSEASARQKIRKKPKEQTSKSDTEYLPEVKSGHRIDIPIAIEQEKTSDVPQLQVGSIIMNLQIKNSKDVGNELNKSEFDPSPLIKPAERGGKESNSLKNPTETALDPPLQDAIIRTTKCSKNQNNLQEPKLLESGTTSKILKDEHFMNNNDKINHKNIGCLKNNEGDSIPISETEEGNHITSREASHSEKSQGIKKEMELNLEPHISNELDALNCNEIKHIECFDSQHEMIPPKPDKNNKSNTKKQSELKNSKTNAKNDELKSAAVKSLSSKMKADREIKSSYEVACSPGEIEGKSFLQKYITNSIESFQKSQSYISPTGPGEKALKDNKTIQEVESATQSATTDNLNNRVKSESRGILHTKKKPLSQDQHFQEIKANTYRIPDKKGEESETSSRVKSKGGKNKIKKSRKSRKQSSEDPNIQQVDKCSGMQCHYPKENSNLLPEEGTPSNHLNLKKPRIIMEKESKLNENENPEEMSLQDFEIWYKNQTRHIEGLQKELFNWTSSLRKLIQPKAGVNNQRNKVKLDEIEGALSVDFAKELNKMRLNKFGELEENSIKSYNKDLALEQKLNHKNKSEK